MKFILITLLILLTGCSISEDLQKYNEIRNMQAKSDGVSIKYRSPYMLFCVHGVEYMSVLRDGVTVLYDTDGKVKTCTPYKDE